MIVAILNEKGGAGKTTISIHLARHFTKEGIRTALIDADPQASTRDWHAISEGKYLDVYGMDRASLSQDLNKIKKNYDWIFIDCPSKLDQPALECADILLIPLKTSILDMLASEKLIKLIKYRIAICEGKLKAAFIVNGQKPNTIVGREFREDLQPYELPIFKSGTYDRIIYSASFATGSTACDESDHLAIQEITNICNELKEFAHGN